MSNSHHSNIEQYLTDLVMHQSFAIEQLTVLISSNLPAIKDQADGILSTLRSSQSMASHTSVQMLMEGYGPIATQQRRGMFAEQGHVRCEEDVQRCIADRLPKIKSEKNETQPYHEFLWRVFGFYQYNHNSSGWADERVKAHVHGDPVNVNVENVFALKSGLYKRRNFSYYSKDVRYLLMSVTTDTVVEITEEREFYVWSYVELERRWVRHQNARYVDFEVFKQRFQSFFTEMFDLRLAAMPESELIEIVQRQLVKTPLRSRSYDEWNTDVVLDYKSDFVIAYRQMEQVTDFNDAEVFVYRMGKLQLNFTFKDGEGRVSLSKIDGAPSYHIRTSSPHPVTQWSDLPIMNKNTLLKNCVDTIVRVHNNENRPAAPESSSEPTSET